MVKPSSILSSLMPATSNRSQPSNSQIAMSGRQSASIASNSFATYYQTTFYSRLNSLGGVKRFNERFRIKGHLGAGAHGLILWAVDKNNINKSNELTTQFTEPSRNQNADNYDLDFIVNDLENAFESSSDDDDGDSTDTVDLNAWKGQYAVKRIFIRNRIVPVVIVREIKVLQLLRSHPNIISLLDVCPSGSSINLIFPLLPTNLTTLIYSHQLNSSQCSLYTQMLAEGVAYLHQNGIVHRDIKPSNLLIDWNGVLKLADFGQARAIDIGLEINGHRSELTYQVCTRWYRAPELLYGATNYGYDVDMWSVGCVIGEMIQEWPLFKGDSDIEQLSLVVKALGTPKGEWTEMLPDFNKIQFVHDEPEESEEMANRFPRWLETIRTQARSATNRCTDQVMDLLSKLCRYTERINAQQLLQHPFLNLSSVKQNREKLLIKARYIKHLSGPKKNEP